jgi:zinc transport system ATP-binding protein
MPWLPNGLSTGRNRMAEKFLVEAKGVSVTFGGKSIIQAIDLSVSKGEIVTLIGPNGAGKTTLIKAVLGLRAIQQGEVKLKPKLNIGYMPQRLSVDLNMPMTVRRFVGLAGRVGSGKRQAVLQEVGIQQIIDSSIHYISGGEMQRVLLARALLRDPDLLVLDEPAQAVDVVGQADLYQLISRIRDDRGCGVLMVSHDLHLVMSSADNVICINNHLCCHGHPEAVSRDPSYVELFGEQVAQNLALYHHHHDHTHAVDGHVVLQGDGTMNSEEKRDHG